MTIGSPLHDTLVAVATSLAAARDPWWIIGSAAVALHGAEAGTVADVDVLLSIADAGHVLPSIGIAPRRGPDHADFRSELFGTWRMPPLRVEFMAGFRHRRGEHWFAVQPVTRTPIALGDRILFVPERGELRRMIEQFGRPKDHARAEALKASGSIEMVRGSPGEI